MTHYLKQDSSIRKPQWLKTKLPTGETYFQIKKNLKHKNLFTVCQEAKCPNISECWNNGTATFMILGGVCTRHCKFCNVSTGDPKGQCDNDEPHALAETAKLMGLRYVVITMVTRDDLPDGGATHIANVISELRKTIPQIRVETLISDLGGNIDALKIILQQNPEVIAHNIETVKSLSDTVRDPKSTYKNSLDILGQAKQLAEYPLFTKSGFMVGLGETDKDIFEALNDLVQANVDFVTIGQYLQPSKAHLSVKRYVSPDEFIKYSDYAKKIGFKGVASGPLVRSSYKAQELFNEQICR